MDTSESQLPPGDQNGAKKRPVDNVDQPDAKRVKASEADEAQNESTDLKSAAQDQAKSNGGVDALVNETEKIDEVKAVGSEHKGLPKGTAPVKQE